ncbi:MAG: hypothetical protein ACXVFQ_26215 [Solirubrobacteraceae bacterium]
MSALTPQPHWPSDPDHREAVETLLAMAASEHRWGEQRRARNLLDSVEEIIGELPQPYARIRSRGRRVSPPQPDRA